MTVLGATRESMNEGAWRRLLAQIRDGLVVPVLGSQLLGEQGTDPGLQARIAERVLSAYGMQADGLSPGRELNDAVTRVRGSARLQELYETVHEAICTLTREDSAIPAAVAQLAEIADFPLLVTVTPDDMLARCLRRRATVNEIIHSPNLSAASRPPDLPANWQPSKGQVDLLYLFGKAQRTPVFAIHDEDVLEYAHNVISRGSNVPSGFLGELQARNLLFIGCRFPDWLSRFFLRATNKDRLSLERRKREWLVEVASEESLTLFVRSYSKDTEILAHVPPAEFVAELHRRWLAEYGGEREAGTTSGVRPSPKRAPIFFVSYSRRGDRARAEKLVQSLIALGLTQQEIWFDASDIDPGADFGREIMSSIDCCHYFLPLLSADTNSRDEAFVFAEWNHANKRVPAMNREFVIPLIVDPDYAPDAYTARPALAWRGIDFGHAPNGAPDARTLSKLRELVRKVRREGVAA
jgi:hypothetical protein